MSRARAISLLLSFALAACGGSELEQATTGQAGGAGEASPGAAGRAEGAGAHARVAAEQALQVTLALPPALPALPGEFAFRTYVKGTFLTAVGGGGRITDVIHSDATQPNAWERFKLLVDPGTNQYAIETVGGRFLTAVDGGGRTSDVFHSDATQVAAWEKFRFWSQGAIGFHAIQTVSTNYVTALGGGGHIDPPVLHTDATKPWTWEWFRLEKCGDLGSGYQYAIQNPGSGLYLAARNGGGLAKSAIDPNAVYGDDARFRLVRQPDGSYALQTFDGHYVTAVWGGGQVPTLQSDGTYSETLQTDRTAVNGWERFRVIDQGDCTYAIQTVSGYYVAQYGSSFTTDLSSVTPLAKFKLVPFL
jgi:hypothetical protein